MDIHRIAKMYARGIITKSEFIDRKKNANGNGTPQIFWTNGRETTCVIEDCFGISPLVLIADLIKQDKADGTSGGFYYTVRV